MTRRMPCAVWGWNARGDLGSIGIADKHQQAQSHHRQKNSHMGHNIVEHALHRSMRAQGQHHHDAARPGGDRKRQRIENLLLQRSEAGFRDLGAVGIGLGPRAGSAIPIPWRRAPVLLRPVPREEKSQRIPAARFPPTPPPPGKAWCESRFCAPGHDKRTPARHLPGRAGPDADPSGLISGSKSAERKREELGEKRDASHGCNRIAFAVWGGHSCPPKRTECQPHGYRVAGHADECRAEKFALSGEIPGEHRETGMGAGVTSIDQRIATVNCTPPSGPVCELGQVFPSRSPGHTSTWGN